MFYKRQIALHTGQNGLARVPASLSGVGALAAWHVPPSGCCRGRCRYTQLWGASRAGVRGPSSSRRHLGTAGWWGHIAVGKPCPGRKKGFAGGSQNSNHLSGPGRCQAPGTGGARAAPVWLSGACVPSRFTCVRLFVTPWTVACQAPLSMGILQARMLESVTMPSSTGIFPTQGSNPCLQRLLHCRQILYRRATGEACSCLALRSRK